MTVKNMATAIEISRVYFQDWNSVDTELHMFSLGFEDKSLLVNSFLLQRKYLMFVTSIVKNIQGYEIAHTLLLNFGMSN